MGSGEASKGDQDMLDLAGWAKNFKNFTGEDKRQMPSRCLLFLPPGVTQGCLLRPWDSAGYQGASKCSSQGSSVPRSDVKVGLGPTGRSEVDCRMRRRVTAGRWGGGRTPQPPNPFVHPLSHVSGGGLRALRGKSPPPPPPGG